MTHPDEYQAALDDLDVFGRSDAKYMEEHEDTIRACLSSPPVEETEREKITAWRDHLEEYGECVACDVVMTGMNEHLTAPPTEGDK